MTPDQDPDLVSLFGDGGDVTDLDSLFGDGSTDSLNDALEAELAAMLAAATDPSDGGTELFPLSPRVSQPSSAPSKGLSLLMLPRTSEVETLSSPSVSSLSLPAPPVTSDVASEQDGTSPGCFLNLPCRPISQTSPLSGTPHLMLPTLPDPLDVPLSRQDGHTSGTSVVSTQDLIHASPTALCQVSDEEAELEAMLELGLLEEDSVNNQARISPHIGDQEGLGLDQSLIPGNRYAKTETRRRSRLPRRIDLEDAHVEIILPYLFFSKPT